MDTESGAVNIPPAEEAYKQSLYNAAQECRGQLRALEVYIREAIEEGEYHIEVKNLHKEAQAYLTDLGYSIMRGGTIIYWGKKYKGDVE